MARRAWIHVAVGYLIGKLQGLVRIANNLSVLALASLTNTKPGDSTFIAVLLTATCSGHRTLLVTTLRLVALLPVWQTVLWVIWHVAK